MISSQLTADAQVMLGPKCGPLARIADGYTLDAEGQLTAGKKIANCHYKGGGYGWFIKIGQTVFAHPSASSVIPGRTAINVAEHLLAYGVDFDCLVVGHTHRQSKIVWRNRIIIEQGCVCAPHEYECDPHLRWKGQTQGYAVIIQDAATGACDYNASNYFYWGTSNAMEESKWYLNPKVASAKK
jgi:hypothetical protein